MGVIIGMDPHRRPATIEVIDEQARVLAVGRYGTDKAENAEMLAAARKYPDRVWRWKLSVTGAADRGRRGCRLWPHQLPCPP